MVRPRRRVLARRLIAALCVAIAAAGGFAAWHAHFRPPPCRAVHQFVEFNTAAQASLKDKTYFPPGGSYDEPRVPTAADYQAWLDGLQGHADRITAPDLSAHAHRAAQAARDFMADMAKANDALGRQDFLKPRVPPEAKAAGEDQRKFVAEMDALARACPA
ncbi:hypothetical protein MRAB57_1482 [Mycobacterium rhizamassiliense]|jgi:hypothetical protein|uniref:Uncharacterized protein n=1 Tax=Mycobacterium rhizamassiliense TaxID=1841860 RepID=A0A2U3NQ80_9MYCO|nr:hypothetical protein [Mycobacterium rhizamassiliense]SPM33678.1 hypothetical protein MRAB57_1482 [Mycobacterium rhizamassiliense]